MSLFSVLLSLAVVPPTVGRSRVALTSTSGSEVSGSGYYTRLSSRCNDNPLFYLVAERHT